MKLFTVLVNIMLLGIVYAQSPINVEISGNIINFQKDTISISQYYGGTNYRDFLKAKVDKKGNFLFKGQLPVQDIYVIRVSESQHLNLILRNNSNIQVFGDAKNFIAFHNIVGSDESAQLNKYVVQMQVYNAKKDSANRYLQAHPEQESQVNQSFAPIYYEYENFKKNYLTTNQNSPALLPLLSEVDPNQNFEAYEYIVNQIVAGFDGSPTVNQVKGMYLQNKQRREEMSFLSPGKTAPDFTQPKVDGKPLKLSDLKGKVVLIDFWASWCGPCRKENPNVVKIYQKYADKGFTVLSVSLDKDKNAWQEAIKRDNLLWPNHVSDLKAWSNEAAQLYKVSGIPFTVLVDKEGNIIEKNLRGAELENALKSIFGF
jgi:thiol-disulfide isomerase/thioredoxin